MTDTPTKTLKIYKDENNDFVIERINDFNHSFKRVFITEEGLKEGLNAYKSVLHEYEIEATDSVWPIVINHLTEMGKQF